MAHPMQHYGKRKPKPAKTELYRIENPQGYQVDTVKHLIYANVLVPVEPDYEADAEAIYAYLEATNMQGASFFPWANIAKRRWINAYKAALAEKVRPDVRAWHTVFMQALHNGEDKDTAYDAVLDAALGVGEETP